MRRKKRDRMMMRKDGWVTMRRTKRGNVGMRKDDRKEEGRERGMG